MCIHLIRIDTVKMTATISTRIEEKTLAEIDELSKEKQMDRASLVRNLIVEGLSIERKRKVLCMYKDKKISLAGAAEILDIDLCVIFCHFKFGDTCIFCLV